MITQDYAYQTRQQLIADTPMSLTDQAEFLKHADLSPVELMQLLKAHGLRLRSTGYGNFTLEIKRQRALCFLDTLPEREYVPEVPTVLGGGK